MKPLMMTLLLVGAGGCASAVVSTDQLERVLPEMEVCEYENSEGMQAWKCGERGLFAANHEDAGSHADVRAHWITEVNREAGFALRTEVTDMPPLEHKGKKYPVSITWFKAGKDATAAMIVMSQPHSGGQRGWACLGKAELARDELFPWCGKRLRALIAASPE